MLRHVLVGSDAVLLIADSDYVERLVPLARRVPGLRTVILGPGADGEAERADDVGVPVLPWSTLLDHGAEAPRVEVAFHDLQAIMFTSGTTGPSKGCDVFARAGLDLRVRFAELSGPVGKSIYCPLPLFHAAGLWDGVLAALLCGGSIAIVDRFHASTFWDDVRRFDAAVVMSVFSMIPILLKQPPSPHDKDHPLEMFYMGKSSLDEPLHKRFGVRSVETYTSTEAGIATGSPYGQWRVGSCGTVHDRRFHAAVVDEYDREVGPGEPGSWCCGRSSPM